MRRRDYKSINQLETIYDNPWKIDVPLNGTDGGQFHPLVQKDERLVAFLPFLARSADLTYRESVFDAYECGKSNSIEMMNFYLDDELM